METAGGHMRPIIVHLRDVGRPELTGFQLVGLAGIEPNASIYSALCLRPYRSQLAAFCDAIKWGTLEFDRPVHIFLDTKDPVIAAMWGALMGDHGPRTIYTPAPDAPGSFVRWGRGPEDPRESFGESGVCFRFGAFRRIEGHHGIVLLQGSKKLMTSFVHPHTYAQFPAGWEDQPFNRVSLLREALQAQPGKQDLHVYVACPRVALMLGMHRVRADPKVTLFTPDEPGDCYATAEAYKPRIALTSEGQIEFTSDKIVVYEGAE